MKLQKKLILIQQPMEVGTQPMTYLREKLILTQQPMGKRYLILLPTLNMADVAVLNQIGNNIYNASRGSERRGRRGLSFGVRANDGCRGRGWGRLLLERSEQIIKLLPTALSLFATKFPHFVQGFLFQFCEVGELALGNHPQPNLATGQRGKSNFFRSFGLYLAIFSPFFPPFLW